MRGIGTPRTSLNVPTSESQGYQKENKTKKLKTYFKKIMKENFPNLAKEIDFQEVQEAQNPKEVGPEEEHTEAHHNYISQD